MKELQFIIKNGETETILERSPDGWEALALEIDRSPNNLGVLRSFSVQSLFPLDGGTILRNIFYNRIQDETFLIIKKLHPYTLTYSEIYRGVVDFSSYIDSDYNASVKINDTSLSDYIKKNIDTTYLIMFLTELQFHVEVLPSGYEKPVDAIKLSEFLKLIFDKITDGGYVSERFGLEMTSLIGNENIFPILMTNAMGLMGAKFDRVEISLAEFIKIIYIHYRLVISIEIIDGKETLRLLPIASSFPAEPFINITSISKIKVSIAKDFIYNTVKVGYPEQSYDTEIDTSHEIGTTVIFSNESGFIGTQELDLQAKFQSDTISIKKYLDLYGVSIEDEALDYTTFLVHVTPKTITGVPFMLEYGWVGLTNPPTDKTQFNTYISPKRILQLHESYINSCFYGASTEIKFISAPLNIALLYSKDPVFEATKAEGANITRSETPYFIPLYIEFDGMLPETLDFTSLYNPENSKLSFSYNGETFTGFLMNIKAGLYGKKKASFKLLCSPENDLTKLIR